MLPTEIPLAPAGWGFTPGLPLVLSVDQLPALPGLQFMAHLSRFYEVRNMLVEHSSILPSLKPLDLLERYPSLTRQQCFDVVKAAWSLARNKHEPRPRL